MTIVRKVVGKYKVWLLVSLLFSILLIGLGIFGEKGILKVYALEQELQARKARVQALQEENKTLQQEIHELTYNPYFIEKLAREELGLVRPGEIIFEFVSPSTEQR